MSSKTVFQLKCTVQQYKWGKIGNQSEVARLSSQACRDISVQPNEPYAELWMGNHPRGRSVIAETNETLEQWLSNHPEAIGSKVQHQFGGKLPFLFKVLSVNTALSIQIHPTKKHAEELFASDPDHYPDPNHKPEIAVALTDFQALCGFRPVGEITNFLNQIPELSSVIGKENEDALCKDGSRENLKVCFKALMTQSSSIVEQQLSKLVERLQHSDGGVINKELKELLLKVYSDFPGDVGCFGIFFFNYICMKPGQAIFLPANEPHAYLFGDCIECMANSDNVVRCGLTPKFKDVPTLLDMLTYDCRDAQQQFWKGVQSPDDDAVTVFDPPIPDFSVRMIKLAGKGRKKISALDSASIIIAVECCGSIRQGDDVLQITDGSVIFVSCDQSLELDLTSENCLLFQAYCQL